MMRGNPITLVRCSAKRLRTPDVLTAEEFRALFKILPDREQAFGIICATTGLRVCEVLGIKWKDIDFIDKAVNVLCSFVDGAVGPCKTEISQHAVPLDDIAVEGLVAWRKTCAFGSDADWVFASERAFDKIRVNAKCWIYKALVATESPENHTNLICCAQIVPRNDRFVPAEM